MHANWKTAKKVIVVFWWNWIQKGIKWRNTLANVRGSIWTITSIKEQEASWVETLVYHDVAGNEYVDK